MAVVAAPGVEEAHGVDHADYALWVFTLPILISVLLEAPIALLSDRLPRRKLLVGALACLALALLLSASSAHAWVLSLGLALAGAASGIACGIAQSELVAAQPGRASHAMSRWMAFGSAGDALCAPLVATALWFGATHRAALVGVALIIALQALSLYGGSTSLTPAEDDAQPSLPLRAAIRGQSARLWAFLIAAASATLLDEIVVALASLRLHDDIGASQAFAAAAVTGFSLGSLAGALLTERLLERYSPRRISLASAPLCAAALALFIAASTPLTAAVALFLLGAACAPHYPLAKAAAYELVPGKPGLVNALAELFILLDIVLPLGLGRLATAYGIAAALAALALQPLIVAIVFLGFGGREAPPPPSEAEPAQAQRVGDHGDGADGHRSAGQHRAQE